jgi:hypothetical protein
MSSRIADSHLPRYGAEGDTVAMFLWSDRATLAFWLLAGVWLLALVRFVAEIRRSGGRGTFFVIRASSTADLLSIGVPVYGLFVGYVILLAFGFKGT